MLLTDVFYLPTYITIKRGCLKENVRSDLLAATTIGNISTFFFCLQETIHGEEGVAQGEHADILPLNCREHVGVTDANQAKLSALENRHQFERSVVPATSASQVAVEGSEQFLGEKCDLPTKGG